MVGMVLFIKNEKQGDKTMDNNGKIVCPCCGKEWNWVKVRREKMSNWSIPEVFDILEENTLYLTSDRVFCKECNTELIIK